MIVPKLKFVTNLFLSITGPSPFEQSPNYVGKSNGTIVNSPMVPGAQFDRFIQSSLSSLPPKKKVFLLVLLTSSK